MVLLVGADRIVSFISLSTFAEEISALNCKKNSWSAQPSVGVSEKAINDMYELQNRCDNACAATTNEHCGEFVKLEKIIIDDRVQDGAFTKRFINNFKNNCSEYIIKNGCRCCKTGSKFKEK